MRARINMKKNLLLIAVSVFFITGVNAGVNKKNGNFFITYTDIIGNWVGNHQLEITRTYNSKATRIGIFGFGWGSDYETYLEAMTDGSLVVHENGSGATTVFWKSDAHLDLNINLETFENALARLDWTRTAEQIENYLDKNIEAAEFRNSQESHLKRMGLLDTYSLTPGDIYWNYSYGVRMIVIVDAGYLRLFDADSNVSFEFFDHHGRLVKVGYTNGDDLTLSYDSEGRLVFMDLGSESAIQLSYSGGRVSEVRDVVTGDSAVYRFDGSNLVSISDTGGNTYHYTYDRNHNMTSITYTDGTQTLISYGEGTQFTESITDRSGNTTRYTYGYNNEDRKDYWCNVVSYAGTDEETSEHWRWVVARDSSGNYYNKLIERIRENISYGIERNKDDLITAYLLGSGNTRFDFSYNFNGRLERIEGKDVRVDYSYGDRHLETINYDFRGERAALNFRYGESGLTEIHSDDGSVFSVEYQETGQLESVRIRFSDKEEYLIGYDDGEVDLVVDSSGDILSRDISAVDDIQEDIFRTFFEFYQFYKPFTKIYWDGEFLCGECVLGFQDAPGRFQDLARTDR